MLKRERNLDAGEIYDQVVFLNKQSIKQFNRPLSNIVYMGMGEPLLNYDNVMKSIDYITSAEGLGMSPKRITVSTSGVSRGIRRLADEGKKFKLALSLHAADDAKRELIMDINKSNPLDDVMDALKYFYDKTGNKITFEYILFHQFNDSDEDAKNLILLCKKVPAFVNIIEYNQVEGVIYTKSSEERLNYFKKILEKNGIDVQVRRSRGKDIDAACGQLANKNQA
jgi:23S rRNA (adenine2503-C2)-methyltransferase